MLSLFFDKELANGSYKKVDIEEMVPMCFVDKNGRIPGQLTFVSLEEILIGERA